ncbi:hypothetical protein Y695_01678 [Hydrogenophaga sp. T4]|nr:hypothetical protein Y695_01678 [Hydrogenophaga sp. T4]
MFFTTPPRLLRPLHSLLKAPFEFQAGNSIAVTLRDALYSRPDFEDLLALAVLFDEARNAAIPFIASLRQRLEDELCLKVSPGPHLQEICSVEFSGIAPKMLHISGSDYLSHSTIQRQLERFYDLLELKRCGSNYPLAASGCRETVTFLMLVDALALSLAGICKVGRHTGGFDLAPYNRMSVNALRSTWFARLVDLGSQAGVLALAGQLSRAGASHMKEVEALRERILEQDLAIAWHGLSDKARSLHSVRRIHAAAGLTALLLVLTLRDQRLRMSGPAIVSHGLDFEQVSELLAKQAESLVTDQFIVRQNDCLTLHVDGATKGLRQLFRSWAIHYGETEQLKNHVGGLFYEKTHIRERIESGVDFQDRYRIVEGFDRYQVGGSAPSECDVEFIIHDFKEGHYYFIQAKHAILGEKAFFQAVVESVQKDIGKGLHQLREAKRLFDSGLLDNTLQARGISDARHDNCSFILLHNIAQFDYQTAGDIYLYDWATFRNLLKDGECVYGHTHGEIRPARLSTPLIASNPQHVIQRLLSEHPAYMQGFPDPWAPERATTSYRVQDRTIRLRGLGI